MNKTIKRLLSLSLALLMIISIIPTQTFAATVKNPFESGTVNSNVFLDALSHLGYKTSQFTANGKYGSSVPASDRTKIGYNASGATGLEISSGKPNISAFQSNGLCCASYASYVYFNYLPNVYGLDMSKFAKPSNPRSTSAWHDACEKWVSSGNATKKNINVSTNISYMTALDNVAIGAILIFKDSSGYAHTGIYAGIKNGKHFQTNVGNSRGPEIQLIEGFNKNGNYLTLEGTYTPKIVEDNFPGSVAVKKVDDTGKAVSGAKIGVYSNSACTTKVAEVTTNANGVAIYGFVNGNHTLEAGTTYYFKEISAPQGYDLNSQVASVIVKEGDIAYASVNIVDNRQGKISITKYDDSGAKLGAGYVFGVYSDKACTTQVTTLTTDANGSATSGWLSAKTYYVKEKSLPSSDKTHKLNTNVYTVTVTKGGTVAVNSGKFVNNLMRGNAQVIKTSEDGIVEGFTFKLSGTSDSGENINITAKTDSNGVASFGSLLIGTYTVEELNTPNRYVAPASKTIKVTNGDNASVSFNNVLKRGSLKVIKSAEDGLVKGITFRLTGTSLSGAPVNMTAVTDSHGVAMFNDVLISGNSPYVVEEVDTAVKYVIPANQNGAVKWNEVTELTFSNILKKFTVQVTKTDRETGVAQGDATLQGAVYGIYNDGSLIDTYTTDENGKFTTSQYACGDKWTIKEIKPSEGYLLDDTVYAVGANPELYILENNSTSNAVTEQVIKGKIHITKLAVKDKNEVGVPETGAVFSVRLKSTGALADTLTIGADGTATSIKLPYGTYIVHQEKGWEGYKNVSDFEVFVDENEKTYSYILNDYIYSSYIKVIKQDAETGKNIAYSGAGFHIYDSKGNLVTMEVTYPTHVVIDTFYTDENGILITPMELNYGSYTLVEVKAPYGYVLDSTPVAFTVDSTTIVEDGGLMTVTVIKTDYAQKGSITVTKQGEVFWNVLQSDGKYQAEYAIKGLSGAVFEIYAAEDIITLDGTVRYKKGEKVDTVTTDSTGKAISKELYLGKYFVKEVKAPYGYVLNETANEVELTYGGQTEEVVSANTTFMNDRQKASISFKKQMEINSDFGIGNNGEVLNVKFGLYANENITAGNGTLIPKGGLIEIATADKNGNITFKSDIPYGHYYVQEIATDEHYILDGTKYLVTFSYAGQTVNSVSLTINDGMVLNRLRMGKASVLKTDEFGTALQGAKFGLYTSADSKKPVKTSVSDKNGKFEFTDIPYGTWYVKEIEQPTGFILNENVFPVTITDNGEVVKLTIENTYLRGTITLTKVDEEYPENKLTGAIFTVYEDTNKNGVYDNADKAVCTLNEQNEGVYTSDSLIYGRYFVKETKAPTGFVTDTNAYEVFIETDGAVYTVANIEDGCFINAPALGSLKIVKTSEDGIVEGFKFRVKGTSITGHAFDEIFVTDKNGEILIENLRIGNYTVTEIDVADRYITPDSVTVSVETDSVAVANVYNTLKRGNVKVIKTAEDNIIEGIKFHLYGTSLSGEVVDAYAVTDENGIAIFEDILISDENGYIVEEIETADRYLIPEKQTVNVLYGETAEIEFYNELKHGNITLTKVDNEYRDMLLSGAEFEVYYDVNDNGVFEEDIDVLVGTMDETEKGIYLIENVRYGGYFIHEKTAPNGYISDIGYYYVSVTENGETVVCENKEGTGLFINGIKRGNILIVKRSEDGKVEGFSFRVTGNGVDMIVVTDSEGKALIENLRTDSEYLVEEVDNEASKGYIIPEAARVIIADDMTITVYMYNALEKKVEIPNTDASLKQTDTIVCAAFFIVFFAVIGFIIPSKKKRSDNSKNKK